MRWTVAALLTRLLAVLAGGVLYAACLGAVQASVAVASSLPVGSLRVSRRVRSDAVVFGALVAVVWIGLAVAAAVHADGDPRPGLVLGLPLAGVIGWQLATWWEAVSWSRLPGSLPLGTWRPGHFFVRRPYTVTPSERLRHVAIQGATGTGKTTLLKGLILTDIARGAGVCVIDPKDNLVDDLLAHMPADRQADVILFDAGDREIPLGFNPLSGVAPERRSLAAAELIAVFRRYFADSWGARMEHVLRNVILALLEVPQASLLDVPRLLLDPLYAERTLAFVGNPGVREFFQVEFAELLRRRGDVVEPILNKVGPWLTYPELRRIIGQPTSSFDLRQVMDAGKILLVRIPQGDLGEDISSLLGALVVAKLQLAAHTRVDLAPERRRPFYLYVDEFQNFATSSFARILTEARGFALGLVCANQYPEQLSRDLQLAIARNVETTVQCMHQNGRYLLLVRRLEDEAGDSARQIVPALPLGGGDAVRPRRLRVLSRQRYGRSEPRRRDEPDRTDNRADGPRHHRRGRQRDIDED